ncbi:MAG: DUF58 domain-containing protein [Verrucomicrobiae bacterium]|nr:DUF58 domain-containing protein [Verrucomicrobiae bacterium]
MPASRKIHLRPTPFCYVLAGLLFAMWLSAINWENNLGLLVLAMVGSVAVVSAVHARRNLADLEITAGKVFPVFAGQYASLIIQTRNRKGHDSYDLCFDSPPMPQVKIPAHLAQLPAGSHRSCELIVDAHSRGRHEVPGVRVSTLYPLGLFRAWFWQPLTLNYLVYPQPAGSQIQPEHFAKMGWYSSSATLRPGEEFYELRPYLPGESLHHVAWKLVAKGRPWLVKEFATDGLEHPIFDFSHLSGEDVEQRLSQLALWIQESHQDDNLYGLRLPVIYYPPSSGEEHYHRCLTALAIYETEEKRKARKRRHHSRSSKKR